MSIDIETIEIMRKYNITLTDMIQKGFESLDHIPEGRDKCTLQFFYLCELHNNT